MEVDVLKQAALTCDGGSGERRPLPGSIGAMRDPRRCALDPLLHSVAANAPKAPDPIEPDVLAAHEASRGRYGSRKIKAALARSGKTVSRRRICRIMRENGLLSAYGRKKNKVHPGKPNEADAPNIVARGFRGRAPRTHVCSDLTYVRVGGRWNYVCLLIDPYNREIVGHSAGPRKDADLVRSAFVTLDFRYRGVPYGPRQRIRQSRGRIDQQDTEGRVRAL